MKCTENFPTILKAFRKKNNYSQEDLAKELHVSRQAISRWENGKAFPDISNLILLSEKYNIPLDTLLDKEEEKAPDYTEIPKFDEILIPDEVIFPDDISISDSTSNSEDATCIGEEKDFSSVLEVLGLSSILVLAKNMPFLSIPVGFCILIWLVYTKRRYKIVYILAIVCIALGIYELIIFYTHMVSVYGSTYIFFR